MEMQELVNRIEELGILLQGSGGEGLHEERAEFIDLSEELEERFGMVYC